MANNIDDFIKDLEARVVHISKMNDREALAFFGEKKYDKYEFLSGMQHSITCIKIKRDNARIKGE